MKPGKLVFYLYYYEEENFFTDEDGWIIYDLFNIITPLNLYLFQTDNGYNVFPMVGHDDVICEIISVPDECCGLPDYPEPMDVGDDYETLDRYAKLLQFTHYV